MPVLKRSEISRINKRAAINAKKKRILDNMTPRELTPRPDCLTRAVNY